MPTLVANTIKPTSGDTVTFSDCNVSIGGTLTYEDVTNIDAVGIVTARSGIEVLSGVVTAIAGAAVTYYGDGSNLTGVESGVKNFVASGTLANGTPVILKDDGTVGIVTLTTSNTPSFGTPVVFESARADYIAATYDTTNNKVVIAYEDVGNSNYGTAVVGTVSGTSISFGTPVVFESATTEYISATFDSTNGKVVIAYNDNGNSYYGTAVVGTVSGTSISFGTPVAFQSSSSAYDMSATFDPDEGKVVIAWRDYASGTNVGKAIVGNVSGTSISYGSEVQFESGGTFAISTTYDTTNNKVVIAYSDGGDSGKGKAVVGTVSGTSISFGSPVVFKSTNSYAISATFDSDEGKVIIAYYNQAGTGDGMVHVGTVSGTSISFDPASEVRFNLGQTGEISATYDSANEKVVIAFHDPSNSTYGTVSVGTVSGTTISVDMSANMVFQSSSTSYISGVYDSANEKVAIAYRPSPSPYPGTAVVYSNTIQTTNLTTENYIGIAAETIANAATGKINILGGVNSSQSGLTTAKTYYVGQTGILTTTADTPSVVAGTSISDTKVLVR